MDDQMADVTFITQLAGLTNRWFHKPIKGGASPAPTKLGCSSHWLKSEMEAWLQARIVQSRPQFLTIDPSPTADAISGLPVALCCLLSPARNMKVKPQYQARYGLLYESYRKWSTSFTRHAVSWGVCHPNVHYFQNLTPGWVSFNDEKPKITVVPRSLRWLVYGSDKRATPSPDDDLMMNLCTSEHLLIHHPMLEGTLLPGHECLRQRSLANKLINLSRQFGGTGLHLKLV